MKLCMPSNCSVQKAWSDITAPKNYLVVYIYESVDNHIQTKTPQHDRLSLLYWNDLLQSTRLVSLFDPKNLMYCRKYVLSQQDDVMSGSYISMSGNLNTTSLNSWIRVIRYIVLFSTPVLMHGGLTCIAFCPSVRVSLDQNSH